ncbi:uncharacterized protein rab44 isoform X2 [Parambassis ranga]|uniref:Uncharacterized protein rab44 isoform X2 n=1 Tax=Parambassis ranga TaxID=210632 RepID=A0A6P7I0B0_9TELE|nr:uncharacterized protein LOC114435685 isoform X2 [Parambassis ranga]
MSAQSSRKKRLGSRRTAPNQNETSKFHFTDATSVAQHHVPEENADAFNQLSEPGSSKSATQPPPSPEATMNRRKLGTSRRNKGRHDESEPREEDIKGNKMLETVQTSLPLQLERQEELSRESKCDMSAVSDSSSHLAAVHDEVKNPTAPTHPEDVAEVLNPLTPYVMKICENKTKLEGVDSLQAEKVEEKAHVPISILSVFSNPSVDKQQINTQPTGKLADDKLSHVHSVTGIETNKRDYDLFRQVELLQGNTLLSESHAESDIKCSVEQEIFSLPKQKLSINEEHFLNLSVVRDDQHSEDAETQMQDMYPNVYSPESLIFNNTDSCSEARTQREGITDTYQRELNVGVQNESVVPGMEAVHESDDDDAVLKLQETQEILQVDLSSESMIIDVTENSEIDENLADLIEIRSTDQSEVMVESAATKQEVANPDGENTKRPVNENSLETFDQKNEEYHVYDSQQDWMNTTERADSAHSTIYEGEGQIEDDVKHSAGPIIDQDKEEVLNISLQTPSEISAPFDSQHQDSSVDPDEQSPTSFDLSGSKRKLGSSRRNKGRRHVREAKEDVLEKTGGDQEETITVSSPTETMEKEEFSQGTEHDVVLSVSHDSSMLSVSPPGSSFEDQNLSAANSTETELQSSVPTSEERQAEFDVEVSDKSADTTLEGVDTEEETGADYSEDVVKKIQGEEIKPPQTQETLQVDFSSESVMDNATENPEIISVNLRQEIELIAANVSNPDEQRAGYLANESSFEPTQNVGTTQTSDIGRDIAQGVDNIKSSIKQTLHQEKGEISSPIEESKSRIHTFKSETHGDSQLQDSSVSADDETNAGFHHRGNRRKLGSSQRSKNKQSVSESQKPLEEADGNASGNKLSETSEIQLPLETGGQENSMEPKLDQEDAFKTPQPEDKNAHISTLIHAPLDSEPQQKDTNFNFGNNTVELGLSEEISTETLLEGTDKSDITQFEDIQPNAHSGTLAGVSEFSSLDSHLNHAIPQQLKEPELSDEGLTSPQTVNKEGDVDKELTSNTENSCPREFTQVEHSVEQETFSSLKEELAREEELNEHYHSSEVRGDQQTDARINKEAVNAVKMQEMHKIDYSSETQPQDSSNSFKEEMHTGLGRAGNRRKLGSSRRNQPRQHVDAAHDKPEAETEDDTRGNEAFKTTKLQLANETTPQEQIKDLKSEENISNIHPTLIEEANTEDIVTDITLTAGQDSFFKSSSKDVSKKEDRHNPGNKHKTDQMQMPQSSVWKGDLDVQNISTSTPSQVQNTGESSFVLQEVHEQQTVGETRFHAAQEVAVDASNEEPAKSEHLHVEPIQRKRKMGSTRRTKLNRKQDMDNEDETKESEFDTVADVRTPDRMDEILFTAEVSQSSQSHNVEVVNVVDFVSDVKNDGKRNVALNTEVAPNTESLVSFCESMQSDEKRPEGVKVPQKQDTNEQKPHTVSEGAHGENLQMKSTSPNLSMTNRRRKMGSTRKDLGSWTKEKDVLQSQDVNNESTETEASVVDVKAETAPGSGGQEAKLHKEPNDGDSETPIETEKYNVSASKFKHQQTVEENPASQDGSAGEEHQPTPSNLPSTSPKQDSMSESAYGGRRRKMGSHRKSHRPQSYQDHQEGRITGAQNGRDARSITEEDAATAAEELLGLDKTSEGKEIDKKLSSTISMSEAAGKQVPVSDQTTVRPSKGEIHLSQESQSQVTLGHSRGSGVGSEGFNVVMVGDSSVGKTSFMKRAQSGKFSLEIPASIGLDSCTWTVVVDGKPVVLHVWDTAGQERFRSITKQVFHKAQAFLLMYDVTSSQSFSAVSYWANCIQESAAENVTILLLGNKSDQAQRQVKTQQGEILAKEYNYEFMECSAATGENVIHSLETVARMLSQRFDTRKEVTVLHKETKQKKSSGCC